MFDVFWSFEALLFFRMPPLVPSVLGDLAVFKKCSEVFPQSHQMEIEVNPKLSVIIAARNEAHTIENALKSVLAQKYPNLEIILVNDRSNDGTDEILQNLQKKRSRVSIQHVEELPPGWLGKVHAMQQGFLRSTGVWLLFTDADVHFQEGCIERSLP